MLSGTLGASLLGNILAGKGINRAGEGIVRAGHGNKGQDYEDKMDFWCCLILYLILISVWLNNLSRIKDGAYIINLAEYSDTGTHWIALCIQNNDVTYFDSFGVEHIPKEIRIFISNKNMKANIFRIQTYDSIMCGYFCIGFIDFMLAGKTLTKFTNLFFTK